MELIYLLARVDVGRLEEVVHRLREIREVADVQAVTGPYDVIVKLEAERIPTALDIVLQRVRRIPGVLATETLVAVGR
ncbi:MAG: Lrp/AsnC ligand binding domain-containing protein [Thermoplasmata archaeon]|jgi:DNA-binding Lrp family transcriptional regulator